MIKTLLEISMVVGPSVLRSVAGWAEKSFNDRKITKFEVKELAKTVVRVGLIGVTGYYGMKQFGVQLQPIATGFTAVLVDKLFHALKENQNLVRKRT